MHQEVPRTHGVVGKQPLVDFDEIVRTQPIVRVSDGLAVDRLHPDYNKHRMATLMRAIVKYAPMPAHDANEFISLVALQSGFVIPRNGC